MYIIEEGFKRCSRCGEIKPISEFYRYKTSKDGLRSECKECQKAMQAEYYKANKDKIAEYLQANKDKKKAYNADYYKANKDKIADYYQANKDEILKKQAEWRANNKEKKAAYNAAYYQANKDKKAAYHDPILNPLNWAKSMVAKYRQMDRERGFDDSKTITAEWFLKNIAYRPCAHCGLRKVGAIGANRLNNNIGHEASNLEPCCKSCNTRENNRDMLERGLYWFQKMEKVDFKTFVNEHKAKHKNLA